MPMVKTMVIAVNGTTMIFLLIATKRLDCDNDDPMNPVKILSLSLPLKTNPSPAPLIYAYASPLKRRENNAHLP